ncbi:hypothetical protein Landi51_03123 [Colletotrichum acutatum]
MFPHVPYPLTLFSLHPFIQPSSRLGMHLTQLNLPYEKRGNKPNTRHDAKEDPNLTQPIRHRKPHNPPLPLTQPLHHPTRRRRNRPSLPELGSHLGRHPGREQPALMPSHDALENNLPDNHPDPQRDVPHKRKGRRPRRHIRLPHQRLQRNKQRLQVGRDPERRENLKEDQPRPVPSRGQRHKQPKRNRRESHRHPHNLNVPPRLLDRHPDADSAHRQRQRRGEEPHARLDRAGAQHRLEPEEEHQRRSGEGERAEPVDGRQTLEQRRLGRVYAQEEDEYEQRRARDGQIDPEAPPPRHILRQPAADERSDPAGEAPDGTNGAEIRAPLTRAEEVPDGDVHQRHQPAAPEPLDRSPRDQHQQRSGERRDEASDHENDVGDDEDRFAAEDIADFAPKGDRGGIGEQGGGDDDGVEGCEEDGHAEREHQDDGLRPGAGRCDLCVCRRHAPFPLVIVDAPSFLPHSSSYFAILIVVVARTPVVRRSFYFTRHREQRDTLFVREPSMEHTPKMPCLLLICPNVPVALRHSPMARAAAAAAIHEEHMFLDMNRTMAFPSAPDFWLLRLRERPLEQRWLHGACAGATLLSSLALSFTSAI